MISAKYFHLETFGWQKKVFNLIVENLGLYFFVFPAKRMSAQVLSPKKLSGIVA